MIKTYGQPLLIGAIIGICMAIIFATGFIMRDLMGDDVSLFSSNTQPIETAGYPLLDEVQTLIDRHYLREQPDYINRQYGAIRGMLRELGDRNTFFIDPPVTQSESDVLAGTYGGIGVNVQRNEAGEFVMYPFEDGPAKAAGIVGGDILIAVNGEVLTFDAQADVVDQMLRGEVKEDSGVTIEIRRGDEVIEQFILFDVINVPSVQWRVLSEDETIGYIQIIRFTSRTPDEVIMAVNELREADVQALVIDLRDNYGGLLKESIDVASIFLDGGVVLFENSTDGESTFEAEEGGDAIEIPLVVLVNGGTASASELLAGAIQDRQRGILVGQVTYGKGTIQQIYRLSDNSSVHITSAEWFTPDKNKLDGIGLTPDISMIPDENGRDVELGEALRHLQGILTETEEEINGT